MSGQRIEFPASSKFYYEPDDNELMLAYPCGSHLHETTVADWVDEHMVPGTTYRTYETGGCVLAVHLDFPDSTTYVSGRRFRLVRHEDVSTISGTGVVLHGIQYPDGAIAGRWCVPGLPASNVTWDRIEDVVQLHGHHGKTEVEWID